MGKKKTHKSLICPDIKRHFKSSLEFSCDYILFMIDALPTLFCNTVVNCVSLCCSYSIETNSKAFRLQTVNQSESHV